MSERLLSQLAHVEILTPVPEESLRFYVDVLGMEETERVGQSVYLRGWGEFFHHSIQLTEGPHAGLGHVGWRTFDEATLERAVQRLEAGGQAIGWKDDNVGHGRGFRYTAPHGQQTHEVFWEVDRYQPPAALAPTLPNRPQRYVPRGAAVRSLDHVTITSPEILQDVAWYGETLGHRFTEYIVAEDAPVELCVFAMTTTVHLAHDMAIVLDHSGVPGRVNHVAFWVDQRDELLRVAEGSSSTRTCRSSSAPAATGWASRTTSTCASPAACASSSTRVATATSPRTGSRSSRRRRRARTRSTATSPCRTR
jgi:catechol 2,3-dioxygenase